LFFSKPNFEFGDGCVKITILSHDNLCVLVEKLNRFSDEYKMCGIYVASNCRKTYDPVEFVTLIKESQHAYFMKPVVNLFNSHTSRKQEALHFLLDLKKKVVKRLINYFFEYDDEELSFHKSHLCLECSD
jgi:hypothetical protein